VLPYSPLPRTIRIARRLRFVAFLTAFLSTLWWS